MKRVLMGALTALALSVSPFALTAALAAGGQSAEAARPERSQHWAADHRAMMDARLGGMKKPQAPQTPLEHRMLLRPADPAMLGYKSSWSLRNAYGIQIVRKSSPAAGSTIIQRRFSNPTPSRGLRENNDEQACRHLSRRNRGSPCYS